MSELADFLDADIDENKQLVFWRKYSFNRLPVELISTVYETFLTDKKSLSPENQILFDHFHNAITTLDVTIKDLSNIIDIRNTISKVNQKINLQTSIGQIILLLKNDIDDHKETKPLEELGLLNYLLQRFEYRVLSDAGNTGCRLSVGGKKRGFCPTPKPFWSSPKIGGSGHCNGRIFG